jgi:5-methylcytosine-specific restriction protein A
MEKAEGSLDRGKGPNGRNLCRFCGREVSGRRRTFCGDGCVREWELRNNPEFLKRELFKIQKGICQDCGIDTTALKKELKKLPPEERHIRMLELGIPKHREFGNYWDCDHLLPVKFGGGVELDGKPMIITEFVQTLCLVCHRAKTFEMKEELKVVRQAEKRQKNKKPPVRLLRIETKK